MTTRDGLNHLTRADRITVGTECIIHSRVAGSFVDTYVTILDRGFGEDMTLLAVRDRTGRESTLAVPDDTICYLYGSK